MNKCSNSIKRIITEIQILSKKWSIKLSLIRKSTTIVALIIIPIYQNKILVKQRAYYFLKIGYSINNNRSMQSKFLKTNLLAPCLVPIKESQTTVIS